MLFAISALTPGPRLLALWLAGPPRLEAADAIVVLGIGGVDPNGVLSHASLRRTLHAVTLYRRGLAPLVVLSGSPRNTSPSEADARAWIARSLGVPPAAIVTESQAHTTWEEALLLRARLLPRGVHRILLIADVIDMPRARGVFTHIGFTVLPAPPDLAEVSNPEDRLALIRELLGEWLAWGYYRLVGYL